MSLKYEPSSELPAFTLPELPCPQISPCESAVCTLVRYHEERRCSNLGPPQSRISPSILEYTKIHNRIHRSLLQGVRAEAPAAPWVSSHPGLLPLLKSHFPPRLTNLPGQWLQGQANGSNVCRVLRRFPPQETKIDSLMSGSTAFTVLVLEEAYPNSRGCV